eukprot:15134743-Alexandrium_andersonii.AAC.1
MCIRDRLRLGRLPCTTHDPWSPGPHARAMAGLPKIEASATTACAKNFQTGSPARAGVGARFLREIVCGDRLGVPRSAVIGAALLDLPPALHQGRRSPRAHPVPFGAGGRGAAVRASP